MIDSFYKISDIDTIDSPALIFYPEKISANIDRMIQEVDDIQLLRPHVKTFKTAEIAELLINKGISKFKCATIAEAEMLGMVKAKDVLLAFQPVGPKINRLIKVQKKYPNTIFSTIIDNEFSAKEIANIYKTNNSTLNLYLDINVGMNRTGIEPNEEAFNLFGICQNLEGINPIGLHVYDGHLHDSDIILRAKKCNNAFEKVKDLSKKIEGDLGVLPIIIAGGTPTFPIHSKRKNVESSPGTNVLWDFGYKNLLPEQHYEYGALVITRVISKLENNQLCLDLGHKSIAAEQSFPRVHFLNFSEAKEVSHSEEHLVVSVPNAENIQIGTVFYGVPQHICPTCALYESASVIEKNTTIDEWKIIARTKKITI